MISFSLLWVDDDFGKKRQSNNGFQLLQFKRQLESDLENRGIIVEIKTSSTGAILDDLVFKRFDLVILDVELSHDDDKPSCPSNGFEVIERIRKIGTKIPIVILTQYLNDTSSPYKDHIHDNKTGYLKAFEKEAYDIANLANFIYEIASRPPISIIILSDLHVGYIPESTNEGFQEDLLTEFRNIAKTMQKHYLVITGDFAWKNPENDLPQAALFVSKLRKALDVTDAGQFHFCPGNHDVSFIDSNPWQRYHSFVEQLAVNDPKLMNRFYAYQDRASILEMFNSRRSTLAVTRGKQESVLFAALNSCNLNKDRKNEVMPEIGESQLNGLRKLLENEPKDQLRFAILHHPLFAAPGGDHPDERPLLDQAKALHQLSSLGFRIIIHGHSHFSAVHEHRIVVLNEGGSPIETKLCVIASPTLGAEPSAATPHRQFLILNISPIVEINRSRTLSLCSRIYNQRTRQFDEGNEIKDNVFWI